MCSRLAKTNIYLSYIYIYRVECTLFIHGPKGKMGFKIGYIYTKYYQFWKWLDVLLQVWNEEFTYTHTYQNTRFWNRIILDL